MLMCKSLIIRCGIQGFSRGLEFIKLSANMGHSILTIYDRRAQVADTSLHLNLKKKKYIYIWG